MWTQENRSRYDRSKLRYPSDLTSEEWSLIGPLVPPAKRGGNKRSVDERAVINGGLRRLRLSEQCFVFDKWSVCGLQAAALCGNPVK